jgi:hypothetical protein
VILIHLISSGVNGVCVRVKYPRYRGLWVTVHNSGCDRFPPTTNDQGIMHPIPDTAPPLLAEEEGP